ncbi:MAG: hypothetical protein ACOY4R_27485 [Pseudomonadota bacterium]
MMHHDPNEISTVYVPEPVPPPIPIVGLLLCLASTALTLGLICWLIWR